MLLEPDVRPGAIINHPGTGGTYEVMALGKLRAPDGTWLPAARYQRVEQEHPEEFYRPIADFLHSFVLIKGGRPLGVGAVEAPACWRCNGTGQVGDDPEGRCAACNPPHGVDLPDGAKR